MCLNLLLFIIFRQLSRLESKLSSDITMILTILQQQNGTSLHQKSAPPRVSPPPLEPVSPSDQSYTEPITYIDTIEYSDEYDEANDDSMDTQQLFYDANIPEEVT